MISQHTAIAKDYDDIKTLKKTPAFDRYFLRRLREKRDRFAEAILDDWQLTSEERECKRQIYQEYVSLLKMVEHDEKNALKFLQDE